ncbi:MAG TPA: polyketide cyclase [Cytophagales bacterium]|nr:polyketide cyclase [Cytophagales bacterium]
MENKKPISITIEATIDAPVEKVWQFWNDPQHITQWNAASDDWHCPHSTVELKVGGKFSSTMAAKDGSMSFDFGGIYTAIEKHQLIEQKLEDERKVKIQFLSQNGKTKVIETFDAEGENTIEMQKNGWQAILDNFRRHVEKNK